MVECKKGQMYTLLKDFDKNYGAERCEKCHQPIKPKLIPKGTKVKIVRVFTKDELYDSGCTRMPRL